jgi:two-component system, NarL family, response regulator NreC
MARILIADDSELVRKSLRALFADQEDWQVCGEAGDGQQAIQLAKQLKPDLLILDIAMPVLDGFRAAAEIVKREPTLPIIIYSLHESAQVELEAKKVGARCVVSKGASSELLLRAVREVTAQQTAKSVPDVMLGVPASAEAAVELSVEAKSESDGQAEPN